MTEEEEHLASIVAAYKKAVAEKECCKAGTCKTWEEVLAEKGVDSGVIIGYSNGSEVVTMDGEGNPLPVELEVELRDAES